MGIGWALEQAHSCHICLISTLALASRLSNGGNQGISALGCMEYMKWCR